MIKYNHLSSIYIIIIISSSLITISRSSEAGNWLTKSLDYFSLEKCSPLDKSGITGDFNACLNRPVDSSSSSTGPSSSSSGNWNKFGSFGGGQMKSFGSFGGSSGSFNSFSSGQSKSSSSSDSWPLSLVNDLRQMINCFPKLVKPCMTESEVQFFDTIRSFFQSQVDYASPNGSLIATKISSSRCVQSNSIDTNTICYSTNIHKQNWFGWKINWSDGQMCRFIDDISKCEMNSFDKCSSEVKQFAVGLWEAGLKVTPCLDVTDETTTLSSPSTVLVNPVDQSKSFAPGLSVNPNQSPSHLTNVTNINSNNSQSLELTVNNLTDNNIEPEIVPNQENFVPPTSIMIEPPQSFDEINGNDTFNGSDLDGQSDVNNETEGENDRDNEVEIDEGPEDFKGEMKHSKRVRLHEVDGEGESRHDHDMKHRDVTEEQWSRIKEGFIRKMRESEESRESNESEHEEESEESDEDRNFDIHEDRKNLFGSRQMNQEDEYRDARKRKRNEGEVRRRRKGHDQGRQELKEKNSRRFQEEESRRREREERMREDEERRREDEDRRREEEQRRDEENEMKMERERENARTRGERREDEKVAKPVRDLMLDNPENHWNMMNGRNENKEINVDKAEYNARDCIGSTINSWSSLAENHNSNDLMDLMCRNMDSIHSCLNKHPETNSDGQINRLNHLKFLYSTLCDSNNKLKDNKTIDRVKQCLADNSPSSAGSFLQTKYPNGASSRFWH